MTGRQIEMGHALRNKIAEYLAKREEYKAKLRRLEDRERDCGNWEKADEYLVEQLIMEGAK